jgi:hypothetical protein
VKRIDRSSAYIRKLGFLCCLTIATKRPHVCCQCSQIILPYHPPVLIVSRWPGSFSYSSPGAAIRPRYLYTRVSNSADVKVLLCGSRTPHPIWHPTSPLFCRILNRTCVMPLVSIEVELDHTGASQAGETIDTLNVCISGDFRHAAATVHMASENLLATNI